MYAEGVSPLARQLHTSDVSRSLHTLGVVCGLAAGAWLGAAEAPTKLVTLGISPFIISLAMVAGVFVARWTVPTIMKGTEYVFIDLRAKPHLIVWAILVGALWAVAGLELAFRGGLHPVLADLGEARPALFWLLLGGSCWVLDDLFQQYAVKYIGIGRGIPLSNTNQLWGLAWGALVFSELAGRGTQVQVMVVAGSVVMILGALAISRAAPPAEEHVSWSEAIERECDRYGLDRDEVFRTQAGGDVMADRSNGWRWWDVAIVAAALGIFSSLARGTKRPPIARHAAWIIVLIAATLGLLIAGAVLLWKRTRFS